MRASKLSNHGLHNDEAARDRMQSRDVLPHLFLTTVNAEIRPCDRYERPNQLREATQPAQRSEWGRSGRSAMTTKIELMPWRLQQLGLDPGYVKVCCTSVYQTLDRVCASCKSRRLCARDLARRDVESGMRRYCPNAPTIDALLINWLP
jgi:hypothetical protein